MFTVLVWHKDEVSVVESETPSDKLLDHHMGKKKKKRNNNFTKQRHLFIFFNGVTVTE